MRTKSPHPAELIAAVVLLSMLIGGLFSLFTAGPAEGAESPGRNPRLHSVCARLDAATSQLLLTAAKDVQIALRLANTAAAEWSCPLSRSCAILTDGLNSPHISPEQKDGIATLMFEFKCPPDPLVRHIEMRAQKAQRLPAPETQQPSTSQ